MKAAHYQRKNRLLSPIWWLLSTLSLTFFLACSVVTESRENSFIVSESPRLMVQTENGHITVQSSGVSAIQVTATIKNPKRVDYQAVQRGNTVSIISSVKGGFNFFQRGGGADILVLVPQKTDLGLESKNGRVSVAGVTGQITLRTSNGAIGLTGVPNSTIQAETSNGQVDLAGVSGDVRVQTSNGGISVRDFNGQMNAQTNNGSIEFEGTLRPGSVNQLKTSNGSVNVTLTETPGVTLDASTSNGRVRISDSLPITAASEVKEHRWVGIIGPGGRSLEIDTSNGSIIIR